MILVIELLVCLLVSSIKGKIQWNNQGKIQWNIQGKMDEVKKSYLVYKNNNNNIHAQSQCIAHRASLV
jgi:hypothetical protein